MHSRSPELDKLIENLCEGKDDNYKTFIKKMIYIMNDKDKWEKLSELKELTEKLKNKNIQ